MNYSGPPKVFSIYCVLPLTFVDIVHVVNFLQAGQIANLSQAFVFSLS